MAPNTTTASPAKPPEGSEAVAAAVVSGNPNAAILTAVVENGGVGAVAADANWFMIQDAVSRLEIQISGHDGHGGLAGQIEKIDDRLDTLEGTVNQVKIDVVRLQTQIDEPPPRLAR
jgi:hypothetical protein